GDRLCWIERRGSQIVAGAGKDREERVRRRLLLRQQRAIQLDLRAEAGRGESARRLIEQAGARSTKGKIDRAATQHQGTFQEWRQAIVGSGRVAREHLPKVFKCYRSVGETSVV